MEKTSKTIFTEIDRDSLIVEIQQGYGIANPEGTCTLLLEALTSAEQEASESKINENNYLKRVVKVEQENAALKKENEELKEALKQYLPEDCVLGYGEPKFCHYRNGDGNKCKNCI